MNSTWVISDHLLKWFLFYWCIGVFVEHDYSVWYFVTPPKFSLDTQNYNCLPLWKGIRICFFQFTVFDYFWVSTRHVSNGFRLQMLAKDAVLQRPVWGRFELRFPLAPTWELENMTNNFGNRSNDFDLDLFQRVTIYPQDMLIYDLGWLGILKNTHTKEPWMNSCLLPTCFFLDATCCSHQMSHLHCVPGSDYHIGFGNGYIEVPSIVCLDSWLQGESPGMDCLGRSRFSPPPKKKVQRRLTWAHSPIFQGFFLEWWCEGKPRSIYLFWFEKIVWVTYSFAEYLFVFSTT